MRTERNRVQVGAFECIAISDGTFVYKPPTFPPPAAFLFANAPKESLEQALRAHDLKPGKWVEWTSPYICALVKTRKHRVLVDTGAGDLGPNTGRLLENLNAEGASPVDIDTVILTHGHPDHIGGNTTDGKPAFPNARYVMWKDEWNFWTSEPTELKAEEHIGKLLHEVARSKLPPVQDQLDLVDSEKEIVSGIHAVPALGHTRGHMAVAVTSDGNQLLCMGDAILHPIHVEQPDWHAVVDFSPQEVANTRRRLLDRATEEKALVLAFHFPFPGFGHVVRKGKAWRWHPIETAG